MRVLFALITPGFGRLFQSTLTSIAERGHDLDIVFTASLRKVESGDTSVFDDLVSRYPNVTWRAVPIEGHEWENFASSVRHALDWMRYLDPIYADAFALRARAEARVPPLLRRAVLRADPAGRARIGEALLRMERALPVPRTYERLLAQAQPDLVAVTPMVDMGSTQVDLVRAARQRGIPTVLPVASWDNLTNKGVIREAPDRTFVWNGAQADEAVELHGLARESVVVTGAHSYDHWFVREPSTTRRVFCEQVGLPADRPYVLWLGSSYFIAPDEIRVIRNWLAALRAAGGPLADVGVLVRPHPSNGQPWRELDAFAHTVVWPRAGAAPLSEGAKADFYDSIHHSVGVVGINTSAQIETAIIGRPVLTFLADEVADGQTGTLHFDHLRQAGGEGLLHVADTLADHLDELRRVVAAEGEPERRSAFLEAFVRPYGLEQPATPRFVDALEELARSFLDPVAERRSDLALRALLGPIVRAGARPLAQLQAFGVGVERGTKRARRLDRSRKRILFVLDQPGLLMHFDETVRALASRGHDVQLAFGRDKWPEGLGALEGFEGPGRILIQEGLPVRRDVYTRYAERLRALTDYVHYLQPQLYEAHWSRGKKRTGRMPALAAPLRKRDELPPAVAAMALRALARLERALPSDPVIDRFIAQRDPDAVVVSPLVLANAYQTDVIKSAQRVGRPAMLAVASWDNLSSKGRIRITPERISVWNSVQAAEAADYHQLPPELLDVTGAQPFDRWFDREPSTSRADFCARHDLDPDLQYLLFVGSTRQGYDMDAERRYAFDLVRALRESDDERVRGISVLVRPHPTDFDRWAAADLSALTPMKVAQRDNPLPVLSDDRSEYYDTLYHAAAVVGLNSSSMIEAAIVGRPVHTVSLPEWHDMQHGLLHFRYLLAENGGFLREARTFREHVELLGEDLRDPAPTLERNRRFVAAFIRPHGPEVSATDTLADAIERLATESATTTGPDRDALDRAAGAVVVAGVASDRLALLALRRADRALTRVSDALHLRAQRARAAQEGSTGPHAAAARVQRAVLVRAARVGDRTTRASRAQIKARGDRPDDAAKKFKKSKPEKAPKAVKSRLFPGSSELVVALVGREPDANGAVRAEPSPASEPGDGLILTG
ncbi:MAG: hypothetical protein WKF94_02865 [Solirubrobacteraceae bacterium]